MFSESDPMSRLGEVQEVCSELRFMQKPEPLTGEA